MPSSDQPPRSGPPASRALLNAALGGLLWLSVSCGPSDDPVADAGPPDDDAGIHEDARTDPDAGSDGGSGVDAGSPVDAGATMDGGLPMDAGPPIDGGSSMDATPAADAAPVIDAAGLLDRFCDVVDDRVILSSADAGAEITLEEFTAMCADLGGYIEIHPHCGGVNSCRGVSYDRTIGIITEHTCAGLNTCAGFSCVVP